MSHQQKSWVQSWGVVQPNICRVGSDDADFIYAVRFNGTIPEYLKLIIGGSEVRYAMHNQRIWNASAIPVGKMIYHIVEFVLPEDASFDDVDFLISPKTKEGNSLENARYLSVWFDKDQPSKKLYNALHYSFGMGAMYIVSDSKHYVGLESLDHLVARQSYMSDVIIQPNYDLDDPNQDHTWW